MVEKLVTADVRNEIGAKQPDVQNTGQAASQFHRELVIVYCEYTLVVAVTMASG